MASNANVGPLKNIIKNRGCSRCHFHEVSGVTEKSAAGSASDAESRSDESEESEEVKFAAGAGNVSIC